MLALIAQHLPPSAATLHLLDIGAQHADLTRLRPDIVMRAGSLDVQHWDDMRVDAIVASDHLLTSAFLAAALQRLRAGGRLIILNTFQPFDPAVGDQLSAVGFVRILVERLPQTDGMLIRGERAHTTQNTQVRIRAATDATAPLTLAEHRGRFVHLLVRQTPNKPAWKLTPEDVLVWHTVQLGAELLAFTSLPNAVAFMQTAVLAGTIHDVNKVAKFRTELVTAWAIPVVLNPSAEVMTAHTIEWYQLDMASAEAPDE